MNRLRRVRAMFFMSLNKVPPLSSSLSPLISPLLSSSLLSPPSPKTNSIIGWLASCDDEEFAGGLRGLRPARRANDRSHPPHRRGPSKLQPLLQLLSLLPLLLRSISLSPPPLTLLPPPSSLPSSLSSSLLPPSLLPPPSSLLPPPPPSSLLPPPSSLLLSSSLLPSSPPPLLLPSSSPPPSSDAVVLI